MKHIKPFNESQESVKEFCDTNLAYLIDEGFVFDIAKGNLTNDYIVRLRKRGSYFKWTDIKNDFIPFMNIIQNEYKLQNNHLQITRSNNEELLVKISKLDNLINYWDIKSIIFSINKI
jgi:hypothetical protein